MPSIECPRITNGHTIFLCSTGRKERQICVDAEKGQLKSLINLGLEEGEKKERGKIVDLTRCTEKKTIRKANVQIERHVNRRRKSV